MVRNWAISVGINNYDNLLPLKYAQKDAEAIATWFKDEAHFEQVFLFTKDSPPIRQANPPIPTQPTFARFQRFLDVQFERPLLKPEDNLWFFFAGHGRRNADQDYLMFLDSNPQAVERTAISVEYVTQRLRRCGADNVVLFIDACRDEDSRSGAGIGQQEHKGVITFYSCRANQKSWEIDELKHGSFTYKLLEGLRLQGEANCATVERLHRYLSSQVPRLNTHYKKPFQNPYLKAEPPYKMYFILLEHFATLKDAEPLKYQASIAENRGDFALAKQLWKRVLALPGVDEDALEAIQRITQKQRDASDKQSNSQSSNSSAEEKGETPENVLQRKYKRPTNYPQINNLPIREFKFEVVTVNNKGQEVKREKGQAQYFTEYLGNSVELDMVCIPGGSFWMGTEEEGIKRLFKRFNLNWDEFRREKPQHEVTVQSFFIGKYPVTQAQWKVIASLPKIKLDLKSDPSHFKSEDRPVEQVSWDDAIEFCQRLLKQTGKDYRLPTEAEWEYACRAGTTTPFHFGETITSELANYNASTTYASEPKGWYRRQTTPVGNFPPNAFGLYDMHGNVYEWCNDYYALRDGNAELLNFFLKWTRVLFGGSWIASPWNCGSAFRDFDNINRCTHNIGFRIVCIAPRM